MCPKIKKNFVHIMHVLAEDVSEENLHFNSYETLCDKNPM